MNIEKYTGNADNYLKFRNDYPQKFIKYLYEHVGISKNSLIADIGSGTGKLSKQLLLKGNQVFCVEPNCDMRKTAEKDLFAFSNFISVNGTAENTTLSNFSVDFITVGTAFHWFNVEQFKKECQRILKPNGKVILVWNSRPVNRRIEVEENIASEKFVINFDGLSGGKEENSKLFSSFFREGNFDYKIFQEKITFNKDNFIGRVLTTFDKLNDEKYIIELSKLFDNHSENGTLSITFHTRSLVGEVGTASNVPLQSSKIASQQW